MKTGLSRLIWVLSLGLLFPGRIAAQTDIDIKTGITAWSFTDERELSGQSRHPGQRIGFDIFVEKGRGLFVPGFHYHRFVVANEDKVFEWGWGKARHLHYFTIPLSGGYKLLEESFLTLSALAGPEVYFYYDLDENNTGLDDDGLHGVSTALTAALHLEWFSFLTFEFRYHHGLQPLVKIRDESRLRGISLSAGIKF